MIIDSAALLLILIVGVAAWLYYVRALVSGRPPRLVPKRLSLSANRVALRWFALGALAWPAFGILGVLFVMLSFSAMSILVLFVLALLIQTSCWLVSDEVNRRGGARAVAHLTEGERPTRS